jgi:hypothetical protein
MRLIVNQLIQFSGTPAGLKRPALHFINFTFSRNSHKTTTFFFYSSDPVSQE